jgi:antitoxin YefM
MIHASFSELRRRLAHFMDRAVQDRDMVVITRQGSEPAVLIALSEYEGMVETLHLRRSPENARILDESIAQAEAGEVIEVVWDENMGRFTRP